MDAQRKRSLKIIIPALILLLIPSLLNGSVGVAQNGASLPDYADVEYGPHERNVLDFWQADSEQPTPVVVFIHGGGFVNGDKSSLRQRRNGFEITRLLENGISVAAINYRFRTTTTLDNIMLDAARAIQFIRYMSNEWNVDKSLIAAYGGSAGGGTSLWLGVHDDLADPENSDPVLRESTRLAAIGHLNSQATYDIPKWADIVGIDPNWIEEMNYTEQLALYGIESMSEIDSPEALEIRAFVDMPSFMDRFDPPMFLENLKPVVPPETVGEIIHHPNHAIYLKAKCDELGIPAILMIDEVPRRNRIDVIDFFIAQLVEQN